MHPFTFPALCLLQLFFALTWTVYVLFLPQLAEQAGIGKGYVLWLLLLDQAIFAVMDWALGAHADRVAVELRKLGLVIALVAGLSTFAFLAIPLAALAANGALMLAVIVVWSLTASVLRAPPLVLLARAADLSARPQLAAWYLFGLGLAGALAPYLTLFLRSLDARLPFALAGIAVLLATLALTRLAPLDAPAALPSPPPRVNDRTLAFLAAALLLGVGFQIHFSLNAAPRYLALAPASDLPWLMPVFWIGFNLAIFPVSLLAKRTQELPLMAAGAALGALAGLSATVAGHLGVLVACEFAAGVGWAAAMLGVVTAAMRLGTTGREGYLIGGCFSLFAVAIFARLSLTLSGIELDANLRAGLQGVAIAAWGLAALLLAWLTVKMARAPALQAR